ncbi:MAG: hypothetical protein ABIE36_02750 [Candidatus Diapherotrites archaeon]
MKNKKAQGMSTSTIILMILGLVILVILILGFTLGWNKFLPWLKTNNLETIKTTCAVACSTNSIYDFCTLSREVNDGENDKFSSNCEELSTADKYKLYGITPCPNICP